MSKNRRPREARRIDRHVRLHHWIMDTPAWKTMPAPAKVIYVGLARHYNSKNNGKIGYSVRQAAEDACVSKNTAWRMLCELQTRGFIVLMTKGAFSRKFRHATEWRLTEFPCDVTNELPSKDFARWQPPENLEHGPSHRTERFDQRYRTVLPIEQSPFVTASYGSTTGTVDTSHGSTRGTLIVNQG